MEAAEDPAVCSAEGEAGREGPVLVFRRKNWGKRARGQVRTAERMPSNCGSGEGSGESLGLQGDPASPS